MRPSTRLGSSTHGYGSTQLVSSQSLGDFVKALLVNANPKPINEDTKREPLIAIATSGAFDKVDRRTTSLAWSGPGVREQS